jgi:hypothetical protein
MGFSLFRRALDQEHGRENQEAAGDRREPNVSEEVSQ